MLWKLFSTFFNIGAFTIGGGYAMIPLIRRDVVEKNGWLSEEEFIDMIAIAQAAPGALAINASIIVGYKIQRKTGAFFASLGAALPSFLIILLIASFWLKFKDNHYLKAFMAGARPAVVALLASAAVSMGKTAVNHWTKLFLIAAGVAAVSLLGLHPISAILLTGLVGYIFFRPAVPEEDKE